MHWDANARTDADGCCTWPDLRVIAVNILVPFFFILPLNRRIQICGGAQLVIGAFLLWTHRQYSAIVNDQFWEPFVVIIALGLVAQLICYFGWTSTSKKHRCYLGTVSSPRSSSGIHSFRYLVE